MEAMPKVGVYPVCSECRAPYVLRLAFVLPLGPSKSGQRWVWQRDCKHRRAVPLASNSKMLKASAPPASLEQQEKPRNPMSCLSHDWCCLPFDHKGDCEP